MLGFFAVGKTWSRCYLCRVFGWRYSGSDPLQPMNERMGGI